MNTNRYKDHQVIAKWVIRFLIAASILGWLWERYF